MTESATLAEILRAAGINAVIWIDDKFDIGEVASGPEMSVDLLANLAALHGLKQAPSHSRLSHLVVDDDVEVWRAAGQVLADEAPPTELAEVVNALRGQVEGAGVHAAEYSKDEFDEILSSFGDKVTKFGLVAWKQQKAAVISALSHDTLVIVDREFVVEGTSIKEGEEILKELLAHSGHDASVVLLTHSVGTVGEDSLRQELVQTHGLPIERFSVLAKGGEGGAETRLRRSIRIILTHRTCFVLLQRVAGAMLEGIAAAKRELADQSVYDLDLVLFEKSLEEGASELDVIARLLQLRQRVAVEEMLANDMDCFEATARLRGLRHMQEMSAPEGASSALALLPEWRRNEVFDQGMRLNKGYAPIACGDVFQAEGAQAAWVLLVQPCDVAVRSDGKRKFEEATWVKAKPIEEGSDQHTSPRFFRLPGLVGPKEWQLDFNEWGSVSLRCLDLAAFNSDGRLRLRTETKPSAAMLPGWVARLRRAVDDLSKAPSGPPPRAFQVLSLSDRISNREPKFEKGELSFRFTRIGRIRPPRSVAAYAAFTSYQSRVAFDHDFAEKLGGAHVGDKTSGPPTS